MKTSVTLLFSLIIIAVLAYAVSFSGCSNTVTGPVTGGPTTSEHQALTEADFIDTNYVADPQAVVYLHLEHLHSPIDTSQHDTDSLGIDIFRIRIAETAEHTFRIGDSSHFAVTLIDKTTRTIVFHLDPVNNFITVTIPEGDYIIVIRSLVEFTGGSDTHQNVFIQRDLNTALSRGSGDQQVYADSNSVHTLLSTNSCPSCNLSYVDLHNANLSHANLYYANLSYANLKYADLSYANLYRANLKYANLYYANLSFADLSHSYMDYANLYGANLCNSFKFGIEYNIIYTTNTLCWP